MRIDSESAPGLFVALACWLGLPTSLAAAAPTVLAPVVVTATRSAQDARETPFKVDVFNAARFRNGPGSSVDDVLRESAAFSLFRRTGSLSANPTAQGVSLRGIGPSGASRTLVLLDGVPLNDPFGGWIAWSKVPREAITGAEIVRGGGSGSWGNAALGGVVQLFTTTGEAPATVSSGALNVTGGSFTTSGGELAAIQPAGDGSVQVSARSFRTDGFHPLSPRDRGPVDEPLASQHEMLQAAWRTQVGAGTTATVTGRWFSEERGNGTERQENFSREGFASVALHGRPSEGPQWSGLVYFQRQNFDSYFSAVNASRTAETPANHQFDVPAEAVGASWAGTWRDGASSTTAGGDYRRVKGHSAEYFFFGTSDFTRLRIAGGEQDFVGVFANHERGLGSAWRGTAGLRVDGWRNAGGFRRESDRATGASLRDDRYEGESGFEFSHQLGAVWTPADSWRVRFSTYRAFRLPTLNEYYRPFRVGIISTEANAALRPETLRGAEVSLERDSERSSFSVTGFAVSLTDAVANVTLSRTPSAIARQRQNVDRVGVAGLEVRGEWRPVPAFRVAADWLWNDAEIERAAAQPLLEGRALAQVPRHTVTLGIDWDAGHGWKAGLRMRRVSEQFEDDENQLALAEATTIDARVAWRFREGTEVSLNVENIWDETVETGRSNEGVVSLGAPRIIRASVRHEW